MYRFWNTIIKPVLKLLKPTSIIEIGSDKGNNTRNLVDFCVWHGATLYAIDPEPKFDVAAWEQQYGYHFVFYRSLSLNAIPLVDRFDVVLIDGDHNWYTVFNELMLIDKRCRELGQPFPLVMLHDVGWPYGRRDLYYNPQNIPEAYRKPYAKKGIRPGSPELVDDGGLNSYLFNSLYENNYQSGVLTAVEDFVAETEQDLDFVFIPGHYGLGALIPVRLKEKKKLAEFINSFNISPVMIKHVENIEGSRINAEIKKLEQQAVLRAKEAEISDLRKQLSVSDRTLAEIREQVAGLKSKLDSERVTWQEERQLLEVEREEQQNEAERLREKLEQQVAALRAKEVEVSDLREQLSVSDRTFAEIREQVAALKSELEVSKACIKELESRVASRDAELEAGKERIRELKGNVASREVELETSAKELDKWAGEAKSLRQRVASLETRLSAVYASRSWRITKPLRALSRGLGLRGLLQNVRRAFKLVWWLGTGQFSRPVNASLPYYRRYVPQRIKTMIPDMVRRAVKSRLANDDSSQRGHNQSSVNKAATKAASVNYKPATHITTFDAWQIYNGPNRLKHQMLTETLSSMPNGPKFSMIMPVFNPPIDVLNDAIKSVLAQSYKKFELILVDDCSTDPAVRPTLKKWALHDVRVKLLFRKENGHISAATNTGVEAADGDFLVFVDNDDKLPQDALAYFVLYLNSHPETDIIYSDDAKLDGDGPWLVNPKFKPDWSPELLLSYCYISHLKAIRTSLYKQIGGCRIGFEGSQDHDLLLRASEQARHVGHIPQILYHRRVLPTSTAFSGHTKPYSFEAGRRAVEEAFHRRGVQCRVIHPDWAFRAGVGIYLPVMPDGGPSVAIIIPTKNNAKSLRKLISSLDRTTYKNYNVYIIDNNSDERETIEYLSEQPYKVFKIPNPGKYFNFAHINNEAVKQVSEDFILFLNDDTQIINPRWLSQMVGWLRLPGVGAVGARLLYPDGRVQHAGIALHLNNGLTAFRGLSGTQPGYLWFAKVSRNCYAVTAATMLTRRDVFLEVGGFDDQDFAVAYNDVDYCLRLQDAGYRVVFCGEAELYHHENQSRGKKPDAPKELAALRKRLRGRRDPFYNPHLDRDSNRYEVKPTVIPPYRLNKPLRVLVVTHNLNHEGAPNSALELICGLYQRGVINPLVISPLNGPLRAAYEKHGICVQIMPEVRISKGLKDFTEYDNRVRSFLEIANQASYDLVYCNTAVTFWAVDAALRAGIPSVWNIRESEPWETYYDELPSEVASRALLCFAAPYRVVFVSNETRSRWSPVDRMNNFQVIHNGLNLERFNLETRTPKREEARQILGLNEKDISVLLLGTICPRKGQKDLLLALQHLPVSTVERLSVFLVGSRQNSYSQSLEKMRLNAPAQIRDKIHIISETGNTAKYWNAADIFCCTSRLESYPRVILEAMAKSLPIITTPVFGIKEQVRENENALFYSPGDIEKLAECLERLVIDHNLRARLASNSRLVLRSLTDFEDMLDEYQSVFHSASLSCPPKGNIFNQLH